MKTLFGIAALTLFLFLAGRQQPKPPPVEQECVTLDPSDVPAEVKKLNAKGYYVLPNNLIVVGEKVIVLVGSNELGDEEEEGR